MKLSLRFASVLLFLSVAPGISVAGEFSIEELVPDRSATFVSGALHGEFPPFGSGRGASYSNFNGVPPVTVAPARTVPHIPHFGVSTGRSGAIDGFFFSPANGVELTAKPTLRQGLQGQVGITFRF